ncbi:SDR family oxidoreductase [Haliangium ochraceum]|uniref:Short-chain dehydrogenase/reductase SDR n=1 Tax=Haliangium ochraceum (strain DSM 14365 / JCM 11303 / SMP-2) TaxID=502025 RepID=D0LRA1_HALO1|nr:SDR family oxidoreductase [Haliangium ochraceum]ACY17129.1 short-chain dehydrogenase/reductase SDR [Haliangium ochraceum DSM 14365]
MSTGLHGLICVVTGASSGIGAAIARALAGEGARVIGLARRHPALPLTRPPAPGEILAAQLDVTDEDAVRARFGELPELDVLIQAAGCGHFGALLDTASDTLRSLLDVHVLGSFLCAREAVRLMRAQQRPAEATRRGHILTIGSIASERRLPGCGAYTAAKSAQAALSRALADEARSAQVRVTHVHAGAVATPLWGEVTSADRARMMSAEELAAVIVSALSHPQLALEELTVLPETGVL